MNRCCPIRTSRLGGLRQGIHYSEVRTDFVQHSLSAILEYELATDPHG